MKNYLTLVAFAMVMLLLGVIENTTAQVKLELNSTITTRHYWRGLMISNSSNYEGDLVLRTSNLQLGAWGGYAFNGEYSEFDFHVGYDLSDKFTISVWDLYASRDRSSIDDYDYFDLNRKTTNHLIDISAKYKISNDFPLSVYWSTLVWGRDLNEKNEQRYSSYVELDYPVNIGHSIVDFYAGFNLVEESMYGKDINAVDVGVTATKYFRINDNLTFPLWAKVAINPEAGTSNLILGLQFNLN
ncbi:hypothetical protein EYV94_20135 [Puteibacter caeruleilacunae]|nr:hypothetical protein EYV94_20135 [Puteibacter caeruleilacunae]